MYNILIVDDEDIERDGVRFLIGKYHLDLNVAEAENGKKALEYLQDHPVDILLLDILMPFMDGLELARKVRELKINLKMIIISAFGEFDYARQAIQLGVSHYLLKPIDVDEFLKVLGDVMQMLDKERKDHLAVQHAQMNYAKVEQYEREKYLLDLLHGSLKGSQITGNMQETGDPFFKRYLCLMLVDFREKFFDMHNDEFLLVLKELVTWQYQYVNLNERQGLLFLTSAVQFEQKEVNDVSQYIKQSIANRYSQDPSIIISMNIQKADEVSASFSNLEAASEMMLFFDKRVVQFINEEDKPSISLQTFDKVKEDIDRLVEVGELEDIQSNILYLTDTLENRADVSVVYIKYLFTDFAKRIIRRFDPGNLDSFQTVADKLYKCENLAQIKEIVLSILAEVRPSGQGEDKARKAIEEVIAIIRNEYMLDLGIESIAARLYFSPSYLGHLFKKVKGQSLVKYITAYRLDRAKELLRDTNMKVSDIAEKVGYPDLSYFCMLFKSYIGVSPARYREIGDSNE